MPIPVTLCEVSNVDIAARNILVHPHEPPPEILFSDPTDGIYIGRTEALNVPFYWNPKYLTNPHIAIVGITGSGKSYLIKTFLTRASFVWNSNAIIIDWAGEYRDWVLQAGGKVIALGKGNYINLLDLGGMRPYDRIKQVMRTLAILTDIEQYPEQKRLTEEAIEQAYLNARFKMDSREQYDELGRPLEPPTLKDVVRILEEKASLGTYPFPAELDNAIYRLKQFTRPGQDFFAQKSTVNLDELVTSGLVDIDLSGLPDERFRALGALSILQFIKERMRISGYTKEHKIRLFVVLDEAWKISKEESSDVVMIVREGRKYRFGLIVASQNPTDISETIFSNVGTTFILKTKFERFLNYLQGSLNFSDYIREKIIGFGVGQAAVSMAFHTPGKFPQTFVIQRIEGEEPLRDLFLDLREVMVEGVEMAFTVGIRKDKLYVRLRNMGVSEDRINDIIGLFEKHTGRLDVVTFVYELERAGIEKRLISDFLKELGVEDKVIINIFAKVEAKKRGTSKTADLILEE